MLCLSLAWQGAVGGEYYVSVQGADASEGLSPVTAFRTVQKGVDALGPGDTLTILPGEYEGSVRREGVGSDEAVTTIRAQLPGTVVLRGDRAVGGFEAVAGYAHVYAAFCGITGAVATVQELDTLQVLERMPAVAELEFRPGVFHHNPVTGMLYVSSSDGRPALAHRYTAAVLPTHGLYLRRARRVVVQGLAMTGFNAAGEAAARDFTLNSTWGLMLVESRGCVIRECRAWLNGRGIGINSRVGSAEAGGDNTIERCSAWANASQFGVGDSGGLTLIDACRDTIRESVAFRNGGYGINIRGAGPAGLEEKNKSRLANNLAWGNLCDFKIKTGYAYVHETAQCTGPGLWSLNDQGRAGRSLMGRGSAVGDRTLIRLSEEQDLDPDAEFADPLNHDYRLQGTSRFRNAAPDGNDRGAYAYRTNVFFVGPAGTDTADGQSTAHAWKTLSRAVKALRAGDTLYVLPGVYEGALELRLRGEETAPITIRGRGCGPVVIRGAVRVTESPGLIFERLHFQGPVQVSAASPPRSAPGSLSFENCRFVPGPGTAVAFSATGASGLQVRHCEFTAFQEAGIALSGCAGVRLGANLYDNRTGVGVRVDDPDGVTYADCNSYRVAARAWALGDRVLARSAAVEGAAPPFPAMHDRHSREIVPDYADAAGLPVLQNGIDFTAGGPWGRPIGCYREDAPREALALTGPVRVQGVSATTANLEWRTSLPATCGLAWGETTACTNRLEFDVNYFGTYSLTGLTPGRTYYFRVRTLKVPLALAEEAQAQAADVQGEPVAFTTLAKDADPRVYYVAPDGNDGNTGLERSKAWRTIQHAADRVTPGDTVRIAGGRYPERVRLRATGDAGRPISFTCMPGEKVVLDGANKALNAAFIAGGKNHLRFDGFYFLDYNREPLQGWRLQLSGEFRLYLCTNIQITRCFSDGRNGYTARSIAAWKLDHLTLQNCVFMDKMSGALMLDRCPNLRIEHCVFARPKISAFVLNNTADQKVVLANSIVTDMMKKKAVTNVGFTEVEDVASLQLSNNCFLVRCFPPATRVVFSDVDHALRKVTQSLTLPDFDRTVAPTHTLFADPQFAGDPGLAGHPADKTGFPPDRMMDPALPLDFASFFATNPELIRRGIGLQPEVFQDFRFDSNRRGSANR